MSPDDPVAPGQAGMDVVNQAQQQAEQAPDMVQSALRLAQPAAVPSLTPSTPPPGRPATQASLARLLDKTRRTQIGRMVDRYQNPSAMTATNRLHSDLRGLAREGEPGRMWYEKSSKRILDYVQGDKDEAHKIAQLIAIYSPQTTVDVNTSNAVKAYNRAKAGQAMWAGDILDRDRSFSTIKEASDYAQELTRQHGAEGSGGNAGSTITKVPLDDSGKRFLFARHNMDGYENIATADRDLKAHLLMNEGIPFEGRKTNNFYRNLMVHIDPSIDQGSTQDLWMARAFGFHDDAVSAATKYDFMEKLTHKLGHELGWKPHQVQAAIWTAMKARQEAVKDAVRAEAAAKGIGTLTPGHNGKSKFTINEGKEDDYSSLMRERALGAVLDPGHIARSARDFSDFLDKNLAHVSWEATPGRDSGHLTGLSDLSPEKRADYHKRISEALQDEQGNDHLAKYLGLLSPGTVEAPGYWQGDVNPASHLQVATTRIKAAEQRPDIDEASKQLLNTYADARGLLLKQDGVGYHRPYFDPQVTKANGIEYNFDRELGAGEIKRLGQHIEQIPGSALVPSGPGRMRILHFGIYDKATDSSTPLKDHRKWHKTVDAVLQRAINDPFTARAKLFASDGELRGNNWKEDPHGENYTRRLGAAGRSDVLQFVSDFLAPKVEAVDQAFAQEHGLKRNKAIEQALRTYGSQEGLMGRRFRRADGGAVVDDGTEWRNVDVSGEGASKSPVEVAINPTHDEITGLVKGSDRGAARLSKDTDGNVYAWDASRALHDHVQRAIGFKPDRKAMSVIGQMPIARLHQGRLRLTDVMGMSFPGGAAGWHRTKRADGGKVVDNPMPWSADPKAWVRGNYGHVTENVPVDWLSKMPGNGMRLDPDEYQDLKSRLQSEGIREPLTISVGKNTRTAHLGEGNHRLRIAKELGYSHVPVRVVMGSEYGSEHGKKADYDHDLIPEKGKYFKADAAPSEVFKSLQGKTRPGKADGGPVDDPTPGIGHNQPPDAMVTPPSPSYIKPMPADDYQRKLSPLGLYSHAAEAVWKQPQMKASPDQFKATLINKHNVKPDEFRWTGYDDAFKGRSMVTKREVRDHFLKNQPQLDEAVYGKTEGREEHARALARENGFDWNRLGIGERAAWHAAAGRDLGLRDSSDVGQEPKYKGYALPGGRNYRELVIHTPHARIAGKQGHFVFAKDKVDDFLHEMSSEGLENLDYGREEDDHPTMGRVAFNMSPQDFNKALAIANRFSAYRHEIEDKPSEVPAYHSSHWDEPNVVTHLRVSDRSGPSVDKYVWRNKQSGNVTKAFDSEAEAHEQLAKLPARLHPNLELAKISKPQKVLHLEELQSDWGQAGRDEGFKDPAAEAADRAALKAHVDAGRERIKQIMTTRNQELGKPPPTEEFLAGLAKMRDPEVLKLLGDPAVSEKYADLMEKLSKHRARTPAGPWVGSTEKWTELGLKRALHEAATGGYDRLVVTPGEEQAKRYNLGHVISKIQARKVDDPSMAHAPYTIDAYDHEGRQVHNDSHPAKELPRYVGAEMARRIVEDTDKEPNKGHSYSGLDLTVGNEGMKKYYDRDLPRILEKLARQHDPAAKVNLFGHEISTGMGLRTTGGGRQGYTKKAAVHSLDITPAMRASILKGQKSFAAGGRIERRIEDGIADRIYRKARKVIPVFGRYDGSLAT